MGSFKSDLELYFLVVLSAVLLALVMWRVMVVIDRRAEARSRNTPVPRVYTKVLPPVRVAEQVDVVDLRSVLARPVAAVPVGFDAPPPAKATKIVELRFQITNVRWPINR